MKSSLYAMLASSSVLAIVASMPARAADPAAPPQSQVAQAQTADIGEEIIVTARRKAEDLQIVPETVEVVTARDIDKYNLRQFTDIAQLIPGLTLFQAPGTGFNQSASMRGVTYDENQSVPPTVAFYLNDVPVDSDFAFRQIYDVGQMEVLKGPQGTIRGEIAPSGSITITSKAPDLEKTGGYLDITAGSLKNTNINGAVNIPIVEDKFALRIAGLRNTDDLTGVHSVFLLGSPTENNEGGRISAKFAPNDDIVALITAQHMLNRSTSYGGELVGTGAPGGCVANPPGYAMAACPAANYNGPPIGPNQYLSNTPTSAFTSQRLSDIEGKIDWTFHGQKLSYVGGWTHSQFHTDGGSNTSNLIPGWPGFDSGYLRSFQKQVTSELRLSSVDPLWGHLDYTAGFFFKHTINSGLDDNGLATTFAGYYGNPAGAPQQVPPNLTYGLVSNVVYPSTIHEYAPFASATFHFDKQTELTGGVRYTDYSQTYLTTVTETGVNGAPAVTTAHLGLIPCAAAHLQPSPYPGYCNVTLTAAQLPPSAISSSGHFHPIIYNFELSHRFNDDVMVYGRTASSWRPGNIQVGPAITGATVPALQPFLVPKPETSKDYEIGVKSEWFDKRVLFDIDFYHQNFHNYFEDVPSYYYLKTSIVPGVVPTVSTANLIVANAPAVVNGVEANATIKVTPQWTISPSVAWDDGHVANASLPCSPPGVSGIPTVATFTSAGVLYFTCKSNQATKTSPPWQLTVSSEYFHHINDGIDGFLRGLLYYYPRNPNGTNSTYIVPAYAILNVYLGVRHPDTQWEMDVYAKNITNNQTITSLGLPSAPDQYFGASGYQTIGHAPRREFGLNIRYAFGSR